VLQDDDSALDDRRKNGDDALSKIIERHAAGNSSFQLHVETVEAALLERLREAETRIDNLIEAGNDTAKRHNHNIHSNNEAMDTCNERFAKYKAEIASLAAHQTLLEGKVECLRMVSASEQDSLSALHAEIALLKSGAVAQNNTFLELDQRIVDFERTQALASERASFAAVLAVEFESNNPVEIGKTFWLKVQRHGGETMEQGTWNGLFFDLPDGKRLPHEFVLEVGDEILTPEL
jgi:chromosome segregation ATPase